VVYTSAAGNALNAFNNDFPNANETSNWALAASGTNYPLKLGYADNKHTSPCPAFGCFPTSPTIAGATRHIANGLGATGVCSADCYDSGAC